MNFITKYFRIVFADGICETSPTNLHYIHFNEEEKNAIIIPTCSIEMTEIGHMANGDGIVGGCGDGDGDEDGGEVANRRVCFSFRYCYQHHLVFPQFQSTKNEIANSINERDRVVIFAIACFVVIPSAPYISLHLNPPNHHHHWLFIQTLHRHLHTHMHAMYKMFHCFSFSPRSSLLVSFMRKVIPIAENVAILAGDDKRTQQQNQMT